MLCQLMHQVLVVVIWLDSSTFFINTYMINYQSGTFLTQQSIVYE